jgi:hypothetical protein
MPRPAPITAMPDLMAAVARAGSIMIIVFLLFVVVCWENPQLHDLLHDQLREVVI